MRRIEGHRRGGKSDTKSGKNSRIYQQGDKEGSVDAEKTMKNKELAEFTRKKME